MSHPVDALMNREIPDVDRERLIQCNGSIPDWLKRAYWTFKSVYDRQTAGKISDEELRCVVTMAMLVSNQPPHDDPAKPFDVKEWIGTPDVIYGKHLRVWWRSAERKAMFIEEKRNRGGLIVLVETPTPDAKGKKSYVKTEEQFVPYHNVLGLWADAKEEQPVEA